MHPRVDVPPDLSALAGQQQGMVSVQQALGLGLSPEVVARLVRGGSWLRILRGVYQTHPAAPTWEGRAWAGHLAAGSESQVARMSAGYIQRLVTQPPAEIHLIVPESAHGGRRPGFRFERRRRLPRPRGSLPCTPPEVTVIDLCVLDPARTVEWVTTALRERLASPKMLRQELALRQRLPVPVRQVLVPLLDDAQGLESPLEELYRRNVERAHGLPRGARQFNRRTGRHDVAYPWGLLVELDGQLHQRPGQVFRDMARDNAASRDGWWTHRYGHRDVSQDPCVTALQVSLKLRRLGWTGLPHHCSRCAGMPQWDAL